MGYNDGTQIYNAGKIDELGSTVQGLSRDYINKIDDITKLVDGLADYWEGETYATFKDGYYEKLKDLDELNTVLTEVAGALDDEADATRAALAKL